jgi:glycerol-3-phosphate dehydrogenase (NAD(P)+)
VVKTVAMIGEGAWGTAVATVLATNGYTVKLWCHKATVAQEIALSRQNKQYLPGIVLSDRIIPTNNLSVALADVTYVFEATPLIYLRSVLEQAKPWVRPEQIWVFLNKGIEQESLLLPTQVFDDVIGIMLKKAVVVGPSFAQELVEQKPTAWLCAAYDDSAQSLQAMLANCYVRPYVGTDVIGTQVGAAIKNVVALGIGMADGAGFAFNTKAFLLVRGLQEIAQLAQLLGGHQETIYGLAGVGDLVMSAFGNSRNFRLGKELGKGRRLKELQQEYELFPEGVHTSYSLKKLIDMHGLSLPFCAGIYEVVAHEKSFKDILTALMQQPLETETISSL